MADHGKKAGLPPENRDRQNNQPEERGMIKKYFNIPKRLCYCLSLVLIFGATPAGAETWGVDSSTASAAYGISGTVSGAVASGVKVKLSGAASKSATTDSSGTYSFTGLKNGSYKVVPSLGNYSFSPTSASVTVSGASVTAVDFVSAIYTISGTVSGAVAGGVTVKLSGAASKSATTDSSGTYSFTGLKKGSYKVTPSLTGYTFSPASASTTVSDADVSGVDFVSADKTATYGISGTVSGDIAGGVAVKLSGAGSKSATTDSSGTYSFTGLKKGSYTITPSLTGYTFSPTSASATVSNANVTGKDFTATSSTHRISGTVSGAIASGVTVKLSGAGSKSATTDSSGTYSFTGLVNGSYTITPSLTGYTFSPTSASVTLSSLDITGADFISTAGSSDEIGDRTDYDTVTLTSGGVYSSAASGVTKQYYQYTSTASDTPAIKAAPGGSLTLTNSKAAKSGATSSTENSGFYGFNAGVLASSSSAVSSYKSSSAASVDMTDCTITTSASGANGAFAFGEKATITLDHVTIITTGDSNSRGVDATYGGSVTISNSKISTTGGSSAALATDRYESYSAPAITATNVEGTTAGSGSPGIYCTGVFKVADSILSAAGSEAAVVEGLNSITLSNTSISGAKKWGVMIYQSMSGDSSTGKGAFTMTGGSLTNTSAGPLFFVCNTTADIALSGATLANSSTTLLKASTAAAADDDNVNRDWGALGGTVTFTASNQTLTGNVLIMDSSSSVAMTLTGSSTLSGGINTKNKGAATLTLDSTSAWTATATSYLTALTLSSIESINASTGITITTGSLSGVSVTCPYTLPGGGKLVVE
jgi:hypothetical protein